MNRRTFLTITASGAAYRWIKRDPSQPSPAKALPTVVENMCAALQPDTGFVPSAS